ncbi:MAG: hypothetical protein Kow0069_37720 [Promethearchaeota archaeon]
MISGIRRASTAVESKQKYFLTRELITRQFRRDSDRENIKKLLQGKPLPLVDYLRAATAAYCYHFVGIRTRDSTELGSVSVGSLETIEQIQKRELFEEIKRLFPALDHEVDVFLKTSLFLVELTKILYGRKKNEEQLIDDLREDLEDDIVEIIRKLPPVFFYDFVGDLTGINAALEEAILDEAKELRATTADIEADLRNEEEDKFIEISKLFKSESEIKERFEFSSFRTLELETLPIKRIITKIVEFNKDRLPISRRGLRAFIEANQTEAQLFRLIRKANEEPIAIDEFEEEVKGFIKEALVEHAKRSPQHFIYYLENLLRVDFQGLMGLLEKYGIKNVAAFTAALSVDRQKLEKLMRLYAIGELDINQLVNPQVNPVNRAIQVLEQLKLDRRRQGFSSKMLSEIQIERVDDPQNVEEQKLFQLVCERVGKSALELKKFMKKREIIKDKILTKLGISSPELLATTLEVSHTLENLTKDIYFGLLGRFCRHLARILECFFKVKEDKTRILAAFNRIFEVKEHEHWVSTKLEELIVRRIVRRQEEFTQIFSQERDALLVNGFLLAHFTDRSLEEAIKELKEEESPLYLPHASLTLPLDYLSPVSYAIAHDLLRRFKWHEQIRRLKVEEAVSRKEQQEERRKEELKAKQEANTFNWIERKITTSLMRITSKGINPNQLYWSDKDAKIASEAIKRHCEQEGVFLCPVCGTALDQGSSCPVHGTESIPASCVDLLAQFYAFCQDKIRSLWERARVMSFPQIKEMVEGLVADAMERRIKRVPTPEDFDAMIDGERILVAKKVADKIGKLLDKALYQKFRAHMRKQRS